MSSKDRSDQGWIERAWASPSLGAVVIDPHGVVVDANATWEALAGSAMAVGQTLISFVCEDHQHLAATFLDGLPVNSESVDVAMFPSPEGVPIDVRLSSHAAASALGRVVVAEPHYAGPQRSWTQILQLNEQLADLQRELVQQNHSLETALQEVRASHLYIRKLEGILPICMRCKLVRGDQDEWMKLDSYLAGSGAVSLSHGYCPECSEAVIQEMEVGT
jgi:hypothetical protein